MRPSARLFQHSVLRILSFIVAGFYRSTTSVPNVIITKQGRIAGQKSLKPIASGENPDRDLPYTCGLSAEVS